MQSDVLFEEMATQVVSSPEMVQKVKAIYLWNITDSEGKTASQWSEWGSGWVFLACAAMGGCVRHVMQWVGVFVMCCSGWVCSSCAAVGGCVRHMMQWVGVFVM